MKNFTIPITLFLLTLFACSNPNTSSESSESEAIDLEAKAEELAKKFIITDGHIDVPYRLNNEMEDVSVRTENGEFDFVRAKEGGLDAPFMSIYVPARYQETGGAKEFADSMIAIVENIVATSPDKFAIATTPSEVKANFEKGIISLPMGMENGAPLGDDLSNVTYFFEKGIRYITLTHGRDNLICDSSYDTTRTWNGLSEYGEQVVKEMNQVGIMIDVSHISDSAFYQVMEITSKPVIASHSSCRHFTPDFERNMSDDMIKKLAENGGVIQINFGSTFLDQNSRTSSQDISNHISEWREENGLDSDDPEAESYQKEYFASNFQFASVQNAADHIDHVVKLVGIDHVGFGSDFDGVGNTLPDGLKDVSKYPNLIHELLKRGYSEEDIEKICYKNVFRVWDEVVAQEM